MKHPLRIVTVAALAVGTLLAFTASGGLAKPNQDLAAADPIVIAMPLALTGVISFYDQPNLAGAQIAVAEINKKGGVLNRPLKIPTSYTAPRLRREIQYSGCSVSASIQTLTPRTIPSASLRSPVSTSARRSSQRSEASDRPLGP